MWFEYLGTLFSKIGAKLAAFIAAVVAVVLLIFGHRRKVDKARKSGRKSGQEAERDRVKRETVKESAKVKDAANEIRKEHANLDRDELRRRMRDSATDSGNK